MSIEIYDNFLDENTFKSIQNEVMSLNFPWFMSPAVVTGDEEELNNLNSYQFAHILYNSNLSNSHYFELFKPILDRLDILSLLKLKVNCNPYTEKHIESGMHVDFLEIPDSLGAKTAVFYINTNNGYTKFEDTGKKVESVENRLVVFDLNQKHTGGNTTDTQARYVLNINYIPYS